MRTNLRTTDGRFKEGAECTGGRDPSQSSSYVNSPRRVEGSFRRRPASADYRELFLFRSALDADEVAALHEGKMLQASLEIYSPLADPQFQINSPVENRAQSLSAFTATFGRFIHVADAVKQ